MWKFFSVKQKTAVTVITHLLVTKLTLSTSHAVLFLLNMNGRIFSVTIIRTELNELKKKYLEEFAMPTLTIAIN